MELLRRRRWLTYRDFNVIFTMSKLISTLRVMPVGVPFLCSSTMTLVCGSIADGTKMGDGFYEFNEHILFVLFLSNEQILEDTGKEVKREHVCYNSLGLHVSKSCMETNEVSKDG